MSAFWGLALLITLALVYFAFVRPRLLVLKATAAAYAKISAAELTIWGRLRQAFSGLKTIVLGAIGVVTSALSFIPADDLPGLKDFNWGDIVGKDTAVKISACIMILMMVTHVVGLLKAAQVKAP